MKDGNVAIFLFVKRFVNARKKKTSDKKGRCEASAFFMDEVAVG